MTVKRDVSETFKQGKILLPEFFERDPIQWRDHPNGDLYRRLFALKHANTALWNAPWGARMVRVPNSDKTKILSFVRRNGTDKVFAVFNLSPEPVACTFAQSLYHGAYRDYFSGDAVDLSEALVLDLEPWSYRVFVQ